MQTMRRTVMAGRGRPAPSVRASATAAAKKGFGKPLPKPAPKQAKQQPVVEQCPCASGKAYKVRPTHLEAGWPLCRTGLGGRVRACVRRRAFRGHPGLANLAGPGQASPAVGLVSARMWHVRGLPIWVMVHVSAMYHPP